MALTPYATVDQLAGWLVDSPFCVPTNAASLLRSATLVVARAINESPYAPDVVIDQPREDATCAQVTAWLAADVDPNTSGINNTQIVKSKANDGASIDYDTSLNSSVTAFQVRQKVAEQLAPEAYAILYAAGLIYAPVPQFDAVPDPGLYVSELGQVGGIRASWPFRNL